MPVSRHPPFSLTARVWIPDTSVPAPGRPVPHMGWSRIEVRDESLGLDTGDYVYFAHSFACSDSPYSVAMAEYGRAITAAVRKDNPDMRSQLENAIECLKQEGAIAKLHEQWFGIPPAAGAVAITVAAGTGVPDMPGYDPTPRTPKCD